jgi:hypothetical protein
MEPPVDGRTARPRELTQISGAEPFSGPISHSGVEAAK